jgi:hypothetical protein
LASNNTFNDTFGATPVPLSQSGHRSRSRDGGSPASTTYFRIQRNGADIHDSFPPGPGGNLPAGFAGGSHYPYSFFTQEGFIVYYAKRMIPFSKKRLLKTVKLVQKGSKCRMTLIPMCILLAKWGYN